jgi:hypothetical protein
MQDGLFILPFFCAERVLSDDSEALDRRDGKKGKLLLARPSPDRPDAIERHLP